MEGAARASQNTIVSSVAWVPRGCFSLKPRKATYENPEELTQYQTELEEQVKQDRLKSKMQQEEAEMKDEEIDDELAEYNMADYDNEAEVDIQLELFKSLGTTHLKPDDDPYLLRNAGTMEDEESDSDDENELQPSDLQLVSCYNEDEGVTTLQVHIYEESAQNLFLHHDILLNNYGLCVEWLNYLPGGTDNKRNLAAVGTFEPIIDIWDLDVVDAVKPVGTLGEIPPITKDKKKKRPPAQNDKSHTGPVIALGWHPLHQNILASGSEDKTVKIWDLQTLTAKFSLNHIHTTPVQGVTWHPKEANILLTGGFDKKCVLIDSQSKSKLDFAVPHDIEALTWNPHYPNVFTTSLSSGLIISYDIRNQKHPIHKWEAHEKSAVSSIAYSAVSKDLLASASHDGNVKFWHQSCGESSKEIKLIDSAKFDWGHIYTVQFFENLISIGGQKGKLIVLDCLKNDNLKPLFSN